jgi:sugar phosphate isomerase/epimerase
MKISFHTCGLRWFSFEETLGALADAGYDACGPTVGPGCHLDPETLTDSEKSAYKKLARQRNIAFSVLNPWKVGFLGGIESGETERFFRKALDIAADLGADGVKFLPESFPEGENAGWRAMIGVLKPLCHHAEQVGVDLLMHNHENLLIDTANCFALLRHHVGSERLQINLDCANMAILMDDPCRAIRDFAGNLAYVRIKGFNDYYPHGHQCVPGSPGDIVDWEAVLRTLAEVGYADYLELVTYDHFPPDFHRTGIEWLKATAAKVGA